jgi:hypothetical protein
MRLAIHHALNHVTPAMLVRTVVLAAAAYGLHQLAVMASLHVLQLTVAILGIALVAVAFNPYDSVPVEGGHDWTPPRRRNSTTLLFKNPWTVAVPFAAPTPSTPLRAPRKIAVRVPAHLEDLEPIPLPFTLESVAEELVEPELPEVPKVDEVSEVDEQDEQDELPEVDEQVDVEAPVTPVGALRTGWRGMPGAPSRSSRSGWSGRSASSSPSVGRDYDMHDGHRLGVTGGVVGWGGCPQ